MFSSILKGFLRILEKLVYKSVLVEAGPQS
jgi:hypothetical protein